MVTCKVTLHPSLPTTSWLQYYKPPDCIHKHSYRHIHYCSKVWGQKWILLSSSNIYIYIYIYIHTHIHNFFIHFNTVCHKTADKYCNNRPLGLFFHYCIFFYYYLKLYEVYKLLTFSLMNNSEKQEVKFHHKDRWAALHDLYIHVFRAESSTNREEMSSSTPASLRAMQV